MPRLFFDHPSWATMCPSLPASTATALAPACVRAQEHPDESAAASSSASWTTCNRPGTRCRIRMPFLPCPHRSKPARPRDSSCRSTEPADRSSKRRDRSHRAAESMRAGCRPARVTASHHRTTIRRCSLAIASCTDARVASTTRSRGAALSHRRDKTEAGREPSTRKRDRMAAQHAPRDRPCSTAPRRLL